MSAAPRAERALPLLAGLLLALALPPAAFLLPSFVGLAPLLLYVATRPAGSEGSWEATRGGFVTGLVFYGARLAWMIVALADRSPAAVPAYLLTVLLLAALLGAFGWALHRVLHRLAVPLPLAAAVLWTALEWLHAHMGPLAFPWLALGTSLTPFPRLAGAADLSGPGGLAFWLAAVNGGVAGLVLRLRTGRPLRWLAAGTVAMAVVPAAYGLLRAATLETRPLARIALVQPDIGPEIKRDRTIALDSSLSALARLTAGLGTERPDLVLWPEVALPTDLAGTAWLEDSVAALSRRADAPIVVGAYGGDAARIFNSAFVVDATGLRAGRYDKRALVPFVERVPFVASGILERRTAEARAFGGLDRGGEAAVLGIGGTRAGVLICFESAFAGLARDYRRKGAEVLLNITNDGWYGRPTWYGRTTALWQHPAHLVLRAIETRTGVARAANTGFSLYIDPLGRVYGRTALFEPTARAASVRTTDVTTLYVRWGDWVGWASAAAAVAGLLGAALAARLPPLDRAQPLGYIHRLARNRTEEYEHEAGNPSGVQPGDGALRVREHVPDAEHEG